LGKAWGIKAIGKGIEGWYAAIEQYHQRLGVSSKTLKDFAVIAKGNSDRQNRDEWIKTKMLMKIVPRSVHGSRD